MAKYYFSPAKQKAVLLLMGGAALCFSRSQKGMFRLLENIAREWKKIDRAVLYRIVREFKRDRLVDYKEDRDGSVSIVLSKLGKKYAIHCKLDEIEIKIPDRWDGVWRMVIFDISEKKKKAREALRSKLKELGFRELQKSVLVFPYECEDEVDFICEVFELRNSVRYIRAGYISNEAELKLKFGLR